MLIVLSPAKTLDMKSDIPAVETSRPDFLTQSRKLVKILREYSAEDLSKLMKTSEKISIENHQRYLNWKTPFNEKNARPAIFTFKGDVYLGLEADTFSRADLNYAQKHIRILSGLYGTLRPLDLMQPYRLEMGTALKNDKGKNLYEFWGADIAKAINKALKEQKSGVLINLASNEYFSAIDQDALKGNIITPSFRDFSHGKYRVLSFFAKKARGSMAAWIIKNRIENPEQLTDFRLGGYRYSKTLSTEGKPVYTRKQKT